MLDKYTRIEALLNGQRKIKDDLENIFLNFFTLPVKMEIEFAHKNDKHIKLKIKDKSSIRAVVMQKKQEVTQEFQKKYPEYVLSIF
jgi:hypothetical protein